VGPPRVVTRRLPAPALRVCGHSTATPSPVRHPSWRSRPAGRPHVTGGKKRTNPLVAPGATAGVRAGYGAVAIVRAPTVMSGFVRNSAGGRIGTETQENAGFYPVPLHENRTIVPPPPDDESFRVLVGEPEPLARAGIKAIIDADGDARIASEATDAGAVTAGARRRDADVVVLSSAMTARLDAAELRNLTRAWQDSGRPVVLLLDEDDRATLADGIGAGIRGFVSRATAADDLIEAVRTTAGGDAFVSAGLLLPLLNWASRLAPNTPAGGRVDMSALSGREVQVLELLGQGLSNTQIARHLMIKEATVRSHVYHIVTKLGLRTRAEAIVAGLRHCERR
jgi:DNA-binding NarL/FixJ family response regulator